MDAVNPWEAIISVGENFHGYPDEKIVNRLENQGPGILMTRDETLTVSSDVNYLHIYQEFIPMDSGGTPPPEPPIDQTTYFPQIQIIGKNLDGETVTILNTGSRDVDMTEWQLISEIGNQIFTFPEGYILKAGYKVNINSGSWALDNPPTELKWTDANIWNNSGHAAFLYDPAGVLISSRP